MASGHIGKETNRQCDMFGEHPDYFNRYHNRNDQKRQVGGNQSLEIVNNPMLPDTSILNHKKSHDRKCRGHRYIAGSRSCTWNQSHEVTEKDDKIEIDLFSKEDKNRFKQIKKTSILLDELRDDDANAILDKLEKEIEGASDGIKARYYNNKGVLELHLREFKNAFDYFKKAHKLMPAHPKYITNCLLAEYFIILPDDVYEKINFSKACTLTF